MVDEKLGIITRHLQQIVLLIRIKLLEYQKNNFQRAYLHIDLVVIRSFQVTHIVIQIIPLSRNVSPRFLESYELISNSCILLSGNNSSALRIADIKSNKENQIRRQNRTSKKRKWFRITHLAYEIDFLSARWVLAQIAKAMKYKLTR